MEILSLSDVSEALQGNENHLPQDLGEISGEPVPAAKQGHRNKHPAQHLVLCLLYTVAFGPQGCGTVPTRAQGLLWPQSLTVPV